jgi:mono/diheme cytochrome c family protein
MMAPDPYARGRKGPSWLFFVRLAIALTLLLGVVPRAIGAQTPAALQSLVDGRELFLAGCAGCHGPDGSGMPDSTVGFEKPATFPDFSGCDPSSP